MYHPNNTPPKRIKNLMQGLICASDHNHSELYYKKDMILHHEIAENCYDIFVRVIEDADPKNDSFKAEVIYTNYLYEGTPKLGNITWFGKFGYTPNHKRLMTLLNDKNSNLFMR